MGKVYVVIVTYNGMAWIDKCLKYLALNDVDHHAIIIDNNSSDGTYEYLKQNFDRSGYTLIKSDVNLWFAKANNIGIKLALRQNADFVFLLNQDCYLHASSLRELVNASIDNKEYGILSPVHLNGGGTQLDFNFRTYMRRTEGILDDYVLGRLNQVYETKFVNAAAWLITSECLRRVGGFDTMVFFHYGEDNNYCQRVLFHKYKIGIVPKARVEHDRHLTIKPFNYKRELTRSKIPIFNINLSESAAFKALLQEQLRLLGKASRKLATLEFRLFLLNLKLVAEIGVTFFRKVSKNRKINKQGNLAWLE
ncbi:glycosyltransferase family 2 protein [Dyadobacter crusticola]|uniref:glycosyltransferase family 2 protein n=1 Tax=Dyadobacter crusticola TaxID=292407 RepID=UPI00068A71A1|nr:glycosyltransferase family 2 protein [Dyadobacter crusticola]